MPSLQALRGGASTEPQIHECRSVAVTALGQAVEKLVAYESLEGESRDGGVLVEYLAVQ